MCDSRWNVLTLGQDPGPTSCSYFPRISAFGPKQEVQGTKWMYLLVKAPKGLTSGRALLELEAIYESNDKSFSNYPTINLSLIS